jgi:hypothetical protein
MEGNRLYGGMAMKNGGCGGSVLCEMTILGSEISVLIYVSSSRVI